MKLELEMHADGEDGAAVLQKLSELANRAKELGFTVEAELEAEDEEEEDEEQSG
jgi:hypothetical protein